MSNLWLFIAGVGVSIPVALGIGGLIYAAVLDGRAHDAIQADRDPD